MYYSRSQFCIYCGSCCYVLVVYTHTVVGVDCVHIIVGGDCVDTVVRGGCVHTVIGGD